MHVKIVSLMLDFLPKLDVIQNIPKRIGPERTIPGKYELLLMKIHL